MRSTLYFLLALLAPQAMAITVQISVQDLPQCVYPTGALYASASGAVGPYTYLWSTGETSATIYDLAAGTYSVTVTDYNGDQDSDTIDLVAGSLLGAEPIWLPGCPDDAFGPAWRLVIPEYIENIGTGPYTFSGATATEMVTQNTGTFLYFSNFGQTTPGSALNVTITDSYGCISTLAGTFPSDPQWLQPQILEVNGACSGGANGSIRVHVPREANGWPFGFELHRAGVTSAIPWTGGGTPNNLAGTQPRNFIKGGLQAGTYYLITRLDWESLNVGTLQEEYFDAQTNNCADTIVVVIPDLGYTCGTLSGNAFVDGNQNCARNGPEPYLPNTVIEVQPGNFYAITDGAGQFTMNLPYGTYTAVQQNALFQEHCGVEGTPFDVSVSELNVTRNFADTSLVGLDVELRMASTSARPGFELRYGINARNLTGATSGTGTVTFTFDPLLTYQGSSPAPASVTGNTITWYLSTMGAFQQRYLAPRFQVPPDINLLGTVLSASATVATVNSDSDPGNNTFQYDVTVTGAYDPNDKTATTSTGSTSIWSIGEDEWIDYLIRFQNTGTDTAFFVVITDTLPETLDPATFQLGVASIGTLITLQEHRVLRFMFTNILLPDSNANEAASHGFVSFRIKPRQPVLPGTIIENTANIFFDYNPPVITEPSVLTAEFGTGIMKNSQFSVMELFPNPTDHFVTINAKNVSISKVEVYGIDGKWINTFNSNGHTSTIDLSGVAPGSYLLRVTDADGGIGILPLLKW